MKKSENGPKHSKNQLAYIRQYEKENTVCYKFRYSKIYDEDVINRINQQSNKADYIRQLVRRDIADCP